jgi:NADH-quinone oxidoreductase subunit G
MSTIVNLEIDGKPVQVPGGSTVMDAAHKLGLYVPHFCWHKKLTIAANCRMCLVEVEKAPKPMPACATPAAEGMKVRTHSEAAIRDQQGVMEFLLINHPLDCPICDQGGECQLQDLAVGYGASNSRYTEPKRVVLNKNLGPLISTDMTRCIHCTRCVRFGQEIAGIMELGMAHRGEHAEIMTFVGRTVDSELSGNVIDLCPVGALTSKPFRYTARTWELTRRKSVSPHDGLGSNLIVQMKNDRVMRVVPLENEAINECWLSDKDRFSYEGLNSDDRLKRPRLRRDGALVDSDWQTALERAVTELKRVREQHGAPAIGLLASPHSTLEELHLAQKLVRGLGSDNVDFRLRQTDFGDRGATPAAPWLGMPITEFATLDRVLVVGSFLRKDHPLLAHRLRQATKRGAQLSIVHSAADELLMKVAHRMLAPPSELPRTLAEIVVAAAGASGAAVPSALAAITPSEAANDIAASLKGGAHKGIFLGNFAQHHPSAGQLHALAQALAELTGATLGFLTEAANSVGGHVVGALPRAGGLDVQAMLAQPRRAYIILHAEPDLDMADPVAAYAALGAAELVVALTPFASVAAQHAHVQLPVGAFTETAGTFVNCEGRAQAFNSVALPPGETRPAWKVLRVLGSMLGLTGFDFESIEAVRTELPDDAAIRAQLSNATRTEIGATPVPGGDLQRIADVPIYAADALVRRAPSLQKTADARPPAARMNAATRSKLRLAEGVAVRVRNGAGEAILKVATDDGVPDGCVRIAAGHPSTRMLGPMFSTLALEVL